MWGITKKRIKICILMRKGDPERKTAVGASRVMWRVGESDWRVRKGRQPMNKLIQVALFEISSSPAESI